MRATCHGPIACIHEASIKAFIFLAKATAA